MGNYYSHNSTIKIKRKYSHKLNEFTDSRSPTEPTEPHEENLLQKYYLPNNNEDIDRQHAHHFVKRYLFQGYFSSPIEKKINQEGFKVLDVGCGAGTWLLDLANKYRNTDFFGLDIKPIFPNEIKPGNIKFIEADIFNGLPFPDNEFDFVHMESMHLIFTLDQWIYAISEIIRVTKPEGYIELSEAYTNFKGYGPIRIKIIEALNKACLQRGVDVNLASRLDNILQSLQGVTNINRDERTVILGPNGGQPGIVFQDLFINFCTSDLSLEIFSSLLNMTKDTCKDLFLNDLKNESKQSKAVSEYYLVRYWAQKINNN
ncbi:S-adenosyl-L-methionine-dependent methyltransferase [Glomus cerebriforme]|uniref:S-adenosyl-L-methionine-dependent methyltransferase n=1 Tax=Glomus cerebriforme TaxID=658196 RepID=A0A397TTL6_9GLOM|nr:S-adenosyl-L-methionine-dependent methyltransferase [Glomus cerebriforme]